MVQFSVSADMILFRDNIIVSDIYLIYVVIYMISDRLLQITQNRQELPAVTNLRCPLN